MPDAAGRWPEDFVRQVRERADIVEVVSETVALRRAGRSLIGRCPFHEERTPSFTVSPERGVFHCFGCQAGGDVFSFLMRRDGLPFREAVTVLAQRFGVPLPSRQLSPAQEQAQRRRQALLRCLEFAAVRFERNLAASPRARAYLEGRGVDEETARAWRLGFAEPAWDGLARALGGAGIPAEVAEQAGLVARRASGDGHYDVFRDRLMFPIADERGRVIGFGGRTLGTDPRKYLNSRESPCFAKRRIWYGLHLARPAMRRDGRAIVVEGYLDAIAAHRHGFAGAVASLGTALSTEQAGTLVRCAEEVVVAYDADAAGAAATWRGLQLLQGGSARVRVLQMPEGLDPDEWLRRDGPAPFTAALDAARPLIEYLVGSVAARHDLGRLAERVAAARELGPALARTADPVERAAYVEWTARQLLLDDPAPLQAAVRSHLAEKGEGYRNRAGWHPTMDRRRQRAPLAVRPSALTRAQEGILGWVGRDGSLTRTLAADVSPGDFDEGPFRDLASALWEAAAAADGVEDAVEGDRTPLGRVLDRELDEGARALAARLLASSDAGADEPLPPAADCVAYLRRMRLQRRLDALRAGQRERERTGAGLPPQQVRQEAATLDALEREIADLKAGTSGRAAAGRGSSGHG